MRLYVGNLPFSIDEAQLRALFDGRGEIRDVAVMMDRDTGRARGFAFVELADRTAGEKAIADLNGSNLGGRPIVVNEANARPERSGRGGGGGGRDRDDRGRGDRDRGRRRREDY